MIDLCGNFQNQKAFDIIIGLTMIRPNTHQGTQRHYFPSFPLKNPRTKPEPQTAASIESRATSSSRTPTNEQRQRYLCQRRAFLIFSKIQSHFNLKADTMFLAFEIFCKMEHLHFKSSDLHCISIFLAMKYEEIYPPTLKMLVEAMEWDMNLSRYRSLQQAALIFLKANLNFRLLNRQLQQQLGPVTPKLQYSGLYLLQIALATPSISLNYSRDKIIQAITLILKQKGIPLISVELLQICKELIFSRSQMVLRYPLLYAKYCEIGRFCVAEGELQFQAGDK